MSLKDIFKQQSKGMESLATTGTIGMHMVSGPLVGFAIGYGLDAWLETGPWLKLVFLVIGIIAGFMNVYEDTQRLRIARACQLLAETTHTVAEICYTCGFNNLSNFIRIFKKKKGSTPQEYRMFLQQMLIEY